MSVFILAYLLWFLEDATCLIIKLSVLSFLEFLVGSVNCSEQDATLGNYRTCGISLPALCLRRVCEVCAKQESEGKVKCDVILLPVTGTNPDS